MADGLVSMNKGYSEVPEQTRQEILASMVGVQRRGLTFRTAGTYPDGCCVGVDTDGYGVKAVAGTGASGIECIGVLETGMTVASGEVRVANVLYGGTVKAAVVEGATGYDPEFLTDLGARKFLYGGESAIKF